MPVPCYDVVAAPPCICNGTEVLGAGGAPVPCIKPTWTEYIEVHIVWPLIAQALIVLLLVLTKPIYVICYDNALAHGKPGLFHRVICRYIGTTNRPQVERPFFLACCYVLLFVFSVLDVVLYADRTYTRGISDHGEEQEIVFAFFYVIIYAIQRLQAGLQPTSAFKLDAMVDVLTAVPVLWPRNLDFSMQPTAELWLSFKYLRIYTALTAFEHFHRIIDLDEFSEFARRLVLFVMRLLSCVIVMAGTIFVLEVLGEPDADEFFIDKTIPTAMGDLSFIQMNYWIITTISTVGYGDFSPKTVPSRLVIIMFIMLGILLFGSETAELLEIRELTKNGKGMYNAKSKNCPHIVVLGNGASKYNSMMETFILEGMDPESGLSSPNLVFLSEGPYDRQLKDFVLSTLPLRMQTKLFFLIGSVLNKTDRDRVSLSDARMAFIVPSIHCSDCQEEDNENILRALEMKRVCPHLRLRLMLLEAEGQRRAVQLGLVREQCFAVHELKVSIFVHSVRVKGFMTLLAGLLQITTEYELINELHLNRAQKQAGSQNWKMEYSRSLEKQIYGFVINRKFEGRAFNEVAAEIYEASNGSVLLIAAQLPCSALGRLSMNYSQGKGILLRDQVVVAISRQFRDCLAFAEASKDWRAIFTAVRSHARVLAESDGAANVYGDLGMAQSYRELPAPQDEAQVPAQLEDLHRSGSYIVLLVLGDSHSTWEEVAAFLDTVRQPYQPAIVPVVVVSQREPPDTLVAAFECQRCSFLCGFLLKIKNLLEAGVEKAESVVVLRGERDTGEQNALLTDYEVVTLAGMVESLFTNAQAGHRPFTIYDFSSTHAVDLIEDSSGRDSSRSLHDEVGPQRRKTKYGEEVMGLVTRKRHMLMEGVIEILSYFMGCFHIFRHIIKTLCFSGMARDSRSSQLANSTKLLYHPRFASGQVFSPDFFGGLLGHIFHFPGTIEFLEALSMPSRRGQTSFAWQVHCPEEWVGHKFSEVVRSWLLGMDPGLPGCDPTLVLALYRQPTKALERIGCDGYNLTLPAPHTTLAATDLITVLGPRDFGQAMHRRGLLRGAEQHRL